MAEFTFEYHVTAGDNGREFNHVIRSNNSTSVSLKNSNSGTYYLPISRPFDGEFTIEFSHGGTVSIDAVKHDAPDVALTSAPDSGGVLVVPREADLIRLSSTANHSVSIVANGIEYAKDLPSGDGAKFYVGEAVAAASS